MDGIDQAVAACCQQTPDKTPPPKPPKVICGPGTQEYVYNGGKDKVMPPGTRCTCPKSGEGESEKILAVSPGYKQICVAMKAVTKAYVDDIANGKVDATAYVKFRTEMKEKMVTVKGTLFPILFHLAKVEADLARVQGEVEEIKPQIPYLKKKIDAIAYHRVDVGGGASGILGFRNETFFGGAGADLYLIGRFDDTVGIAIDADGGFFASNTTAVGWRLKVSAGPQWTLDPSSDGGENRHELGLGVAGHQFGRSAHQVNDADGNFYGYGVGPELWYQLNITDYFNMRLEAGVGFGEVAGYAVDDGKAFNGFGVTPYLGLKFRFGSGIGNLGVVEEAAKPAPRETSPNVLDEVGDDGLKKIQGLDQIDESIEVKASSSSETTSK
jgi:hypothetical protein